MPGQNLPQCGHPLLALLDGDGAPGMEDAARRGLRMLGLIVIIAGLATPAFGVARSLAVLNWLASAGPLVMRLDAVVGLVVGGFLVYAFRAPQAP